MTFEKFREKFIKNYVPQYPACFVYINDETEEAIHYEFIQYQKRNIFELVKNKYLKDETKI